MTKKLSIYALFSVLFLAVGLSASHAGDSKKKDKPTNLVGTVTVPEGMTMEEVKKSVVKAAIGRRWNIIETAKGKVIINLVNRGYDSTLTIIYTKKIVEIYSDSWVVKKSGERKKKKDPRGWIENIKKDIGVFLNRERYT